LESFLKSHTLSGSFGFISNLITIEKYGSEHLEKMQEVIQLDIFSDTYIRTYDHFEVELYSLIYHEITHFLDFTTTSWGLEYIYRKTNYSLNMNASTLGTFKLNFSELKMHNDFLDIRNNNVDLLRCNMRHHLYYDENFGGLILMEFLVENEIQLKSSVNMLSLIEAHAYVSEVLVKLKCIESEPDSDIKAILLLEITREVDDFLNNPEFIEYNMLIVLAKKHFRDLSLKELFIFLKYLFINVLDMGIGELSSFANRLDESFIATQIGYTISMDLRRGMSRHIVAFKLILFVYEFIFNSGNEEKLLSELKSNPLNLLFRLYKTLDLRVMMNIQHLNEYFINLNFLEEIENSFDTSFILESSKFNRTEIDSVYKMKSIRDYKLLDIFLNDMSILSVPNSINLNIEDYSDLTKISDIDRNVSDNLNRNHMSFSESQYAIENLRTNS